MPAFLCSQITKRPPASIVELFRFATKTELLMNLVGVVAAIVAGALQPLMTVVFGALTSAFTSFQTDAVVDPAAARANLFDKVNQDVLYLVYIAIAMIACTFIYMFCWVYTGEATTARVRRRYLAAVLRQNVGYFDKLGAGEVTTRIQTDTHLLQEGISDKIAISVMFTSTFFTGFIVG